MAEPLRLCTRDAGTLELDDARRPTTRLNKHDICKKQTVIATACCKKPLAKIRKMATGCSTCRRPRQILPYKDNYAVTDLIFTSKGQFTKALAGKLEVK